MTAQLLTSELSTLFQESKRKNPELRNAAEKSLSDLKSLPRTSEAQIAADLKSRRLFVRPFLLACATRNPKFAGSGIVGLQRLVVSNALPKDTLAEVLEAFRECTTLALDIQLKVLQALPSLLQNYSHSLTGQLLLVAFQVCFLLYNNKTAVVSNTAAASLQQLVNSTFENSAESGGLSKDGATTEVPIGDGAVAINGATLDAYRLLDDICLLSDNQRPKFLQSALLAQNFGLELLESVLTNHADTISTHPEQVHVLRLRLMPLLIKILSEKVNFPSTIRAMRLLQLIISRLLFALAPECEMALSLLNHMLDPDAAVLWKRVLCLEVFRNVHSEPALVRNIYARYDRQDEKRNIIRDHLGNLVRLASEKPSVIGLGQHSSVPTPMGQNDDSGEQAAVQAGGVVGSIGTVTAGSDSNRSGISNSWSTIRSPCIELLDKSEAPHLPATYIYSLALTCLTTFSEGLARFLLPFTVPTENRSKRKQRETPQDDDRSEKKLSRTHSYGGRKTPVNPLTLKDHVLYTQISTSGHMVEHCWPALLAASSTYLNATLDSENYHSLIRSFQKFTQIAGLLNLATPRDAFLTTLGKHAVPAMNSSIITPDVNRSRFLDDLTDSENESSPVPSVHRNSADSPGPRINGRHLLCLRALLNLGIALGPVLAKSWTIVLETLLQADLSLSTTEQARRQKTRSSTGTAETESNLESADDGEDVGLEITAAEIAASRLFEATSDLSGGAFLAFLQCLCGLLRIDVPTESSKDSLLPPQPQTSKHQKIRSVSSFTLDTTVVNHSNSFILDKIGEVIESNITRLAQPETSASGWDVLIEVLGNTMRASKTRPEVRIKAAGIFNSLLLAVILSEEPATPDERESLRERALNSLLDEVLGIQKSFSPSKKVSQSCEVEIHRLALESLKSILEHCGDSLTIGWKSVLATIDSIFNEPTKASTEAETINLPPPKLIRSAFDSLALICSDFLDSVPTSHLLKLLDTLYSFCAQTQDLNISLTTATFFRNISDYLHSDDERMDFQSLPSGVPSATDLASWIQENDDQMPRQALWLYLLTQLTALSSDNRLEVRHSSLHTLFRIFDACFDQLDLHASSLYFSTVLVKLLQANHDAYSATYKNPKPDDQRAQASSWNETAIVEIEGISKLCSQWLQANQVAQILASICQELFHFFMVMLERCALDVSKAILIASTSILAALTSAPEGPNDIIVAAGWKLWGNGNPALHKDDSERRRDGNQDAIASYLNFLHELLRLTGKHLTLNQTQMVLNQMWVCVVKSTASVYNTDLDRTTRVQNMVLESLDLIPINDSKKIPLLAQFINQLVTLAYEQKNETPQQSQTYIALSKAAMIQLETVAIKHLKNPQIDRISLVVQAGRALNVPMKLKYSWKLQRKGLPPWKQATMTALSIFEAAVPIIQNSFDQLSPFWAISVEINNSIISADCKACANPDEIPPDCDFDIAAFSRARKLLLPALGSPSIPSPTRQSLASSLFTNSLIHEPNIDDLPLPGEEDILSGLLSTHIGRVKTLPPSPRSKLAYILLDELFDLVAVHHDGESPGERINLAKAAAPYLIFRAGVVLKAYVMDNPLRGRRPQPHEEKKEMFYVLRKLIELESEPEAVVAGKGVTSRYKKHLLRLYPMVVRALKVAWRDEAMTRALQDVLEAVGEDFAV